MLAAYKRHPAQCLVGSLPCSECPKMQLHVACEQCFRRCSSVPFRPLPLACLFLTSGTPATTSFYRGPTVCLHRPQPSECPGAVHPLGGPAGHAAVLGIWLPPGQASRARRMGGETGGNKRRALLPWSVFWECCPRREGAHQLGFLAAAPALPPTTCNGTTVPRTCLHASATARPAAGNIACRAFLPRAQRCHLHPCVAFPGSHGRPPNPPACWLAGTAIWAWTT